VDVRKGRKQKWRTLRGEKHSRVAHRQESQKAQQKRRVDKGRSDKCYESPKKETVSHTFKHFIQNLKSYNRVKE